MTQKTGVGEEQRNGHHTVKQKGNFVLTSNQLTARTKL